MKLSKISEAEMEVMQIIWASDEPLASSDIIEQIPSQREIKITTLLTFLSRLTEKGLLSYEKRGKKHYYFAIVTEREYKKFESKSFLSAIHGGSIKSFMVALCDDDEISREELEELKKWLSQK